MARKIKLGRINKKILVIGGGSWGTAFGNYYNKFSHKTAGIELLLHTPSGFESLRVCHLSVHPLAIPVFSIFRG